MPNYTEKQPDGTYVTYTEQEWRDKNAGMGWLIGIGVVLFIIWAIYITFVNIFDVVAIPRYGFDLYFSNITHLHDDGYIKLNKPAYLFSDRTTIVNAESGNGAQILLSEGQMLRNKGHISSDASTWLAVEAKQSNGMARGWIWGPGKVEGGGGAWSQVSSSELDSQIARQISSDLQAAQIEIIRIHEGVDLEKANQDTVFKSSYEKVDSWQKDEDKGNALFVSKRQAQLFQSIIREAKNKDNLIYLSGARPIRKAVIESHKEIPKSEPPVPVPAPEPVVQSEVSNQNSRTLSTGEQVVNTPIATSSIKEVIGPSSAAPLLTAMLRNDANQIELIDLKNKIDDLALRPEKGDVKSSRLLNEQGLAAFKAGLYSEATNYFSQAIKANPADIEAFNNYGYALLKSDQYPAAEKILGYLLAIAPGRTSGWANLGEVYAETARLDAATAAFIVGFQFSTNKQMALDYLRATSASPDASSNLKRAIDSALQRLAK